MTNNTPQKILNIIMSLFLLVGISLAQSPFVGLVLEEIDNGGIVPGTTYRLYAELSEGTLYVIYGDETHPHVIETTTTFYQDGSGSDIQSGINAGFFGFVPTMEFDSWVALGDSYDDAPSDIGDLNFSSFNNTSSWSFGGTLNSDASIYRTSNDPLCVPDANGHVLIGQFTTDGILSGTLHLRGQDNNGDVWEETASIPVIIPGCTDSSYLEYNVDANLDDGSCSTLVVFGCTDSDYIEYNASANTNDGSCSILIVQGCTDVNACNYASTANTDDGSCYNNDLGCGCDTPAADSGYDCSGTCLVDTDGDGVCDQFEINGCTDATACNYNELATEDDGSCYNNDLGCGCDTPAADSGYDCSGTCLVDTDGDGICDEFEIFGCTDALYDEYNPLATEDDASCSILSLTGCTDSIACNYNINAGIEDGSCVYVDGVCEICSGDTDGTGVVIDNDIDNDGVCNVDEVPGCTSPIACNYNELATDFNNSCQYANGICEVCEDGFIIDNDTDGDGVCDADEVLGCTDATACNYSSTSTDDNGSCVYVDGVCESCSGDTDGTGTIIDNDTDGDGVCDADEVLGCVDVTACNYNTLATDDDSSCVYVDGICEICVDSVVTDNDGDGDGICNEFDLCPNDPNNDTDGDGICDDIDICLGDPVNDPDGDGICDIDEIDGCQDILACNYNTLATDDDNSCAYVDGVCESCSGEIDGTGIILDNDIDGDGICDSNEIEGCQTDTACNYNIFATDELDGSCIYVDGICESCSGDIDGTGVIIDNDSDNDEVCDEDDCSPEIYNPNQDCSDINEDDVINQFTIYPNPTISNIYILNSHNSGMLDIEITNSLGQYVYSSSINYSKNQEVAIDVSDYSKGIYQVNLITNSEIQSKLVVVN